MATQEESAPAAETTQEQKAAESAEPAPDDATAAAADSGAATEGSAEGAAAAAAPVVVPRVVIVTGASSGLGLEVTRVLCDAGHDVVMACRSEDKANRAIEKLNKLNLKGTLTYMHVCLAVTHTRLTALFPGLPG